VGSSPSAVFSTKLIRELLPGDSTYGDPLSTAGSQSHHALARRLTQLTAERPGVLREAGLSALQVWQAFAEAQGRGRGDVDMAIAFTDLEDFSEFALEAGDDAAIELLRDVGRVIEPAVCDAGGTVVKRLGDGVMAVFDDASAAVPALHDACARVQELEREGYTPRMRAGLHVGRPRRLSGDLFGVDVNIAARLADQAEAGEVLASSSAIEQLPDGRYRTRRRRRFRVKGVPRDVQAFAVTPRDKQSS
jgi:adenylate cyclase